MLLNNTQQKAVEAEFGPILVIAGAGTGKTRVLISRIIFLIQNLNINPNEILGLTFTNKAANEMKKRIEIQNQTPPKWMGTYSSICLKILREEIQRFNRSKNFTVIDEEDQSSLVKEICKLYGIDTRKITPSKLLTYIYSFKGDRYEDITDLSIENFKKFNLYSWDEINIVKKVFSIYQKKLIENNFVDFDDLLLLTLKLFDTHSDVAQKWKQKFKYVLVDEFQDTNKIQFEILLHLIDPKQNNIFVVGDPDQTIYTWRGAYSEIFNDFMKRFKDYKLYVLDKNYRSTQNILDASNKLIKNNSNRIDKSLNSDNGNGESVFIYEADSNDEESNFVAKQIIELSSKYKYSDIAILYRNNYLSRNIEAALMSHGINYVIYGGVKFYQRKEIKDLLAYLKIMVNDDEFSYKRIINIPKRNIGIATIDNISVYALNHNIPFVNALYLTNTNEFNLTWSAGKIIPFINELRNLKEKTKGLSVSQTLEKIIETIRYEDYLRTFEDDITQRQENIKELISSIKTFESNNEINSIEDYLDKISLYTSIDEQPNTKDNVSLMTIHAAKGLEFKVVFVIGMSEGILPSNRGDIYEERRLSYVAMTRAKEVLYLTTSHGWNPITQSESSTSRFINESKGKHTAYAKNKSVAISDLKLNWFDSHNPQNISERYNENSADINVGDTIVHVVFGDGLVISKKDDTVEILFKHPHGRKTLNAKHKSIRLKN